MASEVVLRVATAAEHVVALFVLIKAARVLQSEGTSGGWRETLAWASEGPCADSSEGHGSAALREWGPRT